MSELKSFNFARLQLQHPDAFFLKLHYSRFKFSTLQKIQFVIALNLLSLLICLLCSLGSIALEYYFFHEAQAAFNMSLMLLITDRKSTRLNSSHVKISYAVFCLKKKNKKYL